MHSNRLGCLTSTGIITTLITLFAIIGFAFTSGSQMFSAGDLSAQTGEVYGGVGSHAEITECSACHAAPFGSESMADRCASCHTDIAAQMFDVAKLHGAIMQKNSAAACRDCHPEHRGATARLTEMGENTFPHEVLEFSLNGHQLTVKNEAFTCKDCHHEDITTFASDSCDSCHRQMDIAFTQAHVLSFGTDCLTCHDGVDKYGDDFSHSGFAFQLNGGHSDVACTKCHLDARTVVDLQSAPQDCFSCHSINDPHEGRFGLDCAACHTPNGWKPAKFDHNLANFKLEGEHAEVVCEKCHVNNAYKGTPTDCYSCHSGDDEHNGQFGTDCSVCHNSTNWDDATFDHNRTNFPLAGRHSNIACEKCHQNGQFKGLPVNCASCHADPVYHAGLFGSNCAECHSANNWSAVYRGPHPGIADEGGSGVNHGGGSCRSCHTSTLHSATCTACHDGNNPEGGGGGDD